MEVLQAMDKNVKLDEEYIEVSVVCFEMCVCVYEYELICCMFMCRAAVECMN